MSRTLVASVLFALGLIAGSAYGAKAVCPEGQIYTCTGGINGVNCWCASPNAGGRSRTNFVLRPVIRADWIGAHSEILLSARLPANSSCTIDFELQVENLDGMVLETHEVHLSASSPYFLLQRTPTVSQYVRVVASGAAHNCPITEFLTFEGVSVRTDLTTGSLLELSRFWPTFTFVPDDDSPIQKPPPILPPNRLPPGFFEAFKEDEHEVE